MFKVYLRKHILPYDLIDTRLLSPVIASSGSTLQHIQFSSGLANQTTSWVGGHLIFSTGTNYYLGSTIGTEYKTGNTLTGVDLSTNLEFAPTDTDTFLLVRKNGYVSYDSNIIDISTYVENIQFDTNIDLGFDKCQITLNQRISALTRIFTQFVSMNVQVYDTQGRRCYSGIVSNVDIDGWGGSIQAYGYGATFSWFDFPAYYDASPSNTSTKILKDICNANPFISKYTLGIDRDGTWDTQQYAVGGIGPLDFLLNSGKCSDAIKEVIVLGDYPNTFNKVALQVWHDGIPVVKKYTRSPTKADYTINESNLGFGYDGVGITGDVSNAHTMVSNTYQDGNGKTLVTPSAYNLNLLHMIGLRSTKLSGSSTFASLAAAVVGASRQDKSYIAGVGTIKVHKHVKHGSGFGSIPPYLMRAGDVVAIEGNVASSSLYRNRVSSTSIFTIGHTSYDYSADVINITPMENPLVTDLYDARVKISK